MPATTRDGAAAVYLPACINRIFGRSASNGAGPSLPEALVEVSRRAGSPVWIPGDVQGTCCSVPWSSKGLADAHAYKANELVDRLWRWSGEGELPIVIDASSCTHGALAPGDGVLDERNAERHGKLEILDSIAWVERLLDKLEIPRKIASATVHPTCSTRHLGLDRALARVAGQLADDVHLPVRATCCGFAGDRGFLHPELTEAATREQAKELAGKRFDAHLCSNRTCEVGLERATGRRYESFVFLLEELTRA